ncbi:uncharacterized protein LOC113507438 [Trichoplusia ni]|uniref:Uncharacterized protein LOC113507438 n=1 Tax=Trichoplusia ni TaxID=7111 RepID=A0A7E5X100_TRINI|nr:uncharacterized protein LOC113507438 [Trichoplusia ni]
MGKEDKKEDSGFGFKDAAKAQETLRLLEQHEPNYRRLTVRGLLGRAKRVLSMTKAEDKVKNIKEAMEVFEKWLAELDAGKEKSQKKPAKKQEKESSGSEDSSSSDVTMEDPKPKSREPAALPSDTVPGLGFKDAAAAEGSLRELQGRDPEYSKLAVKGLIGRAKRVLTCTRDETKLSNIKSAISIFEQFLDEYESQHLSRQNNPYLSLGIVRTAERLAGNDVSDQQRSFIAAYGSVRGEYKRLRTVPEKEGGKTWDIVRNTALKDIKEKYANAKLFTEKDAPTSEHLQMLLWAYSPEPARTKKYVPETHDDRQRRSDSGHDNDEKRGHDEKREHESERKRQRESSEEKPREGKRRRDSSSSDESPAKKSKE